MAIDFNIVAPDVMNSLQLGAGCVLTRFDFENPYKRPDNDDILATTTGGINIQYNQTWEDLGADVDNVPSNMMEFKRQTDSTATAGFTSIKFNPENTKWALGAADITDLPNGIKVIKPRKDVKLSDYKDVFCAFNIANGGGYVVQIRNALSTGGLNIQTNDTGKGTSPVTLTGHVSVNAQNEMPLVCYYIPPEGGEPVVHSVTQNLTNVTSSFTGSYINDGESFEATLTADSGEIKDDEVEVTMGGEDVTDEAYSDATHTVSIETVDGDIVITAEAAEE